MERRSPTMFQLLARQTNITGEGSEDFLQAEDGIRHLTVTGVQTCALPIWFTYIPEASRTARLKQRPWQRALPELDRKSTRLNSSHSQISYAVFCLKKKSMTNALWKSFNWIGYLIFCGSPGWTSMFLLLFYN